VMGGATAAYSRSAAGQMSDLRNTVTNLTESLGKSLLPAFDTILHVLDGFAHILERNKTAVLVVVGALSALGAAFGALKAVRSVNNMVQELGRALRIIPATATKAAAAVTGGAGEQVAAQQEVTAATEGTAAASVEAGAASETAAVTAGAAWKTALVTSGIGLGVIALTELVTHFHFVEHVAVAVADAVGSAFTTAFQFLEHLVGTVVDWIGAHWKLLAEGGAFFLGGPFLALAVFAFTHLSMVENAVSGMVNTIGRVISTVFNVITAPFRAAFRVILDGVRAVEHAFGAVGHFIGGALGDVSHFFGGLFAGGGVVPKHLAVGGPSGTDTIPAWLTPGEGVVSRQGMMALGEDGLALLNGGWAAGGGGGQRITIQPGVVQIRLDSRVLTEAVVQYTLNQAARGPTSLIGGSLVTGAPGLQGFAGGSVA